MFKSLLMLFKFVVLITTAAFSQIIFSGAMFNLSKLGFVKLPSKSIVEVKTTFSYKPLFKGLLFLITEELFNVSGKK